MGVKASAGRNPWARGKPYGLKAAGRGLFDAAMLDSELASDAGSPAANATVIYCNLPAWSRAKVVQAGLANEDSGGQDKALSRSQVK